MGAEGEGSGLLCGAPLLKPSRVQQTRSLLLPQGCATLFSCDGSTPAGPLPTWDKCKQANPLHLAMVSAVCCRSTAVHEPC